MLTENSNFEEENLSEEKLAELQSAFEIFDKDRNGLLEKNDLASLMNYLKFYPKDSELDEILGEFNDGKSKEISFKDFLEIMATRMFDGNAENDLLQAFRVFDKEGRGVINSMNLREALVDVDNDMTKEEVGDLIQGIVDNEGNINYTKLIREFLFN